MVKYSTSHWEDSYFGGFVNIIYDYPSITAPFEMEYECNKKDRDDYGLGFYTYDKLMDLFHLKVKEMKLKDILLSGGKVVEEKTFFSKRRYLVADRNAIEATIQKLEEDTELGNLFKHYKKLIISSEIKYKLPSDDKGGSGGSKESDKGEDDKDDKKDSSDSSSAGQPGDEETDGTGIPKGRPTYEDIESVKDLIERISKREEFYKSNSKVVTNADLVKKCTWSVAKVSNKKIIYSEDEIIQSSLLLKMMDITFDPAEDRVDNLMIGKVDTSKIATVPAGNHHIYYKTEENQTTKPFTVCMLMDESGSMGGLDYRLYRDKEQYKYNTASIHGAMVQHIAAKILYKTFSQILPPDKIFVYGHSSLHRTPETPNIRIYNDKYNFNFEGAIQHQPDQEWCQNYDGPVIENIYNKVRSMTSDNILFISLSDGEPAGCDYGGKYAMEEMKAVIEKCKRDGFVTIGVGVSGYRGVSQIYNYHTVVNDMSQMAKQISNIVNKVVRVEFQE